MRELLAGAAFAGLLMLGGCRICESTDDCAYPAYGGSWQRTIPNHGRVGSIFAPAGAKVAGAALTKPEVTRPIGPAAPENNDEDDSEESSTESLLDGLEDDDAESSPSQDEVDQT